MPLLQDNYRRIEKINGTIYNMSPSSGFMHSQVNGNLYHEIRQHLKDSVCVVSVENLDLHISEDEYVIPDIMIICDKNQIKKDKYYGIPRFVAETLSPATSLKDKTVKKDKYAELGIDEYWIISPKERSVEVYYLAENAYKLVASHILVQDEDDENFNADLQLTLRTLPVVSISLENIFESVE